MNTIGLAPLLLIFPAVGFLFNALVGRRFVESGDRDVGEKWSGWIASVMALLAFVVGVILAVDLANSGVSGDTILLFHWFRTGDFSVSWEMNIDRLAANMILVVTGVGSLIHIYAIGYMHKDPDYSRFFAYFNMFLFFMLILVTGNSYLMLFVGWEGVGLCSYLLIGFWFDRVNEKGEWMNATAGRKAFVVNRIGDLGMVLAMILLFWAFGSLVFTSTGEATSVFTIAEEMFRDGQLVTIFGQQLTVGTVLTIVTALFLVGAAGKSAQIPLYIWLPDAMAGPTPVSALIHAATMVTAGVYLLVRSNVFLEIARASGEQLFGLVSSPDMVAIIGGLTALVAALIAFSQSDVKKVLAYSTISQLGFMVAAAGMGAYVAAMFHLTGHAFFKALLFLASGSVIHGMEHGHHHLQEGEEHHEADGFDPQDMRTMGGLRDKMKTTYVVFAIGALALAGIFPLAGFWSKDEILAHGWNNFSDGTTFSVVWVLLTLAAFGTAFYMGRQLWLVFFGKPRHEAARHAHESPAIMTRPLVILAALSVVAGLLNLPFFSSSAAERAEETHQFGIFLRVEHFLESSLGSLELDHVEHLVDVPETPITLVYSVAAISLVLAVGGLVIAYLVYRNRMAKSTDPDPMARIKPIWWFGILPLNTFYYKTIVAGYNWLARFLAEKVDWQVWHDWFHESVIRDGYLAISGWLSDVFDLGFIDGFLVNGAGRATDWFANVLRITQTGYVRNYALFVFLGVIALLVWFIYIAI